MTDTSGDEEKDNFLADLLGVRVSRSTRQSTVDQRHRGQQTAYSTRGLARTQEQIGTGTPASRAPTRVGGERIFAGRRPGISAAVRDAYWSGLTDPVCSRCNVALTRENRSIDHIKTVSELRTEVEDRIVKTADGRHWLVVMQADIQAAEDNPDNFRPMCQPCNSSRGGRTDTDSGAPQLLASNGRCPDDECAHEDAT
jgi:hypothetical protein